MTARSPEFGPYIEITPSNDEREKISAQFKSSLVLIQSRPLNPETIDSYAEDALADLVNLSENITETYQKQPDSTFGFGKELEDKAFRYFGLKSIDGVLAYVAEKDAEIKQIGQIVKDAQNKGEVIIPPDKIDPPSGIGNGEFKKKSVISRTKTVLFILANDFDVNLKDPEQFSIKTGVLSDYMMRGLSYFQIEVPGLDRTILCCDEEGNVTYVFDNKILKEHGITSDDLATLTKNDINDLLESDSKMGKRVVYSPKFVHNMIGLMTDMDLRNQSSKPRGLYFYPKAPEGVLSAKSIAIKLNINPETLRDEIEKIDHLLGERGSYRFGVNLTKGYTPEQQEIIENHCRENGVLMGDRRTDLVTVHSLFQELGVSESAILRALTKLEDILGPLATRRRGNKDQVLINPEQKKMIIKYLTDRHLFAPAAPEGVLSVKKLAIKLKVNEETITNSVVRLANSIGTIGYFKFTSVRGQGFKPEQQDLIEKHLIERGLITAAT